MSTDPATSVARRRAMLMSNTQTNPTEMQERARHARAAQLPSVPSVPARIDVIALKPRLMHKPAVLEVVGVSYSTLWKMMRENKFPRSLMVAGRTAWFEHEVTAWLHELPRVRLKGDPPERNDRPAVGPVPCVFDAGEFAAMVAAFAGVAGGPALTASAPILLAATRALAVPLREQLANS